MKYAENILRKQLKFSAKLSGIELPADLAQQLDLAFQQEKTRPRKPEPIKITIDHERVASLHEESRVVSEMLATEQVDAEKVTANYENGVMVLVLPKREEAKPKPTREIKIG